MKKWVIASTMMGLLGVAQAAPFEYNGHYYEIVNVIALTWDQAKTAAEARSYSGNAGYLATLTTQAEFDAVKGLMNYGGGWTQAWVGGNDTGSGFNWINSEGAVNLAALGSGWYTDGGEPHAGDYGLQVWGPMYGDKFGAGALSDTGIGEMMVEYGVVPEPTAMALLAIGCAAVAMRRRRVSPCA